MVVVVVWVVVFGGFGCGFRSFRVWFSVVSVVVMVSVFFSEVVSVVVSVVCVVWSRFLSSLLATVVPVLSRTGYSSVAL